MFSRTRASVAAEQSRLRDDGSDSGGGIFCREALAAGTEKAAVRKRACAARARQSGSRSGCVLLALGLRNTRPPMYV